MNWISKSCAALLGLAIILGTAAAADAQTRFRPGQIDRSDLQTLPEAAWLIELFGGLEADPERYAPLPEVRRIMDEVAEDERGRDQLLQRAWERLEEIANSLDSTIRRCAPLELDADIAALRQLGENAEARFQHVIALHDSVVALYNLDLQFFQRNMRDEASQKPEVVRIVDSLNSYLFGRSLRFLERIPSLPAAPNATVARPLIQTGAGIVRRAVAAPLALITSAQEVAEATDATTRAANALGRFPHILEKYEMIVHLAALSLRYRTLIETVNYMMRNASQDFNEHCRCLYRPAPGIDPFDTLPNEDELRAGTILAEMDELRQKWDDLTEGEALRFAELERMLSERLNSNARDREQVRALEQARQAWSGDDPGETQTRPRRRRLNIEVVPNN